MPYYDELPREAGLQVRTGLDAASLRQDFLEQLRFTQARHPRTATRHDRYTSLALATRDRVIERWLETAARYQEADARRVYYLSAEFLMGRALRNNLLNTGLWDAAEEAARELGLDLAQVLEDEPEPGLGNGGLGRLAACFLDSLATLGVPAVGYGIRYEFGIFAQRIEAGWQTEHPDEWLRFGNPWEVVRPEYTVTVQFGGRVDEYIDHQGRWRVRWADGTKVVGVPYDTPVAGYGVGNVNTLRLWSARASEEFDLGYFNQGDYVRSVEEKNSSEVISKVLYPSDNMWAGRELRLKQQYFFVACAIADIVRRHLKAHSGFDRFAEKVAIQLNDTHPAVAIAELMRVLIDLHAVPWDRAWEITVAVMGYTNHTLLAEALERWPVSLYERLLPRHTQIIYEINARFLRAVMNRWPNDNARVQRMSIVEEGPERQLRMAHLAVVGAHKVNGVAELHSDLLKRTVLSDFYDLWPERFTNKTNGVTPRRWLLSCNPGLSSWLTEHLGPEWPRDLDRLEGLRALAEDPEAQARVAAIKRANKDRLAEWIASTMGVRVDPTSIFDVQIKRIHEYKRQLLNALHIVALYLRGKREPRAEHTPRTFIFGGKAAPAYRAAKLIIRFINAVAEVVNNDPDVPWLKVLFVPNYSVSVAERIIPAADISEQVSTAGKEASGTGNMKFSMNGALTVGTLDGANVEIREAVGAENFFLFGLTADEVEARLRAGYNPRGHYEVEAELREVIDLVRAGHFSVGDPSLFHAIVDGLLDHDPYLVLADFADYARCHREAEAVWRDPAEWHRRVIHNVAGMGRFSSDRTIRDYSEEIWRCPPVRLPGARGGP